MLNPYICMYNVDQNYDTWNIHLSNAYNELKIHRNAVICVHSPNIYLDKPKFIYLFTS